MANRRMFSLDIVDSDKFLELTKMAQLLYFHLGMRADDDGFVRNPSSIMLLIGVKKPAYNELVSKNWLIEFDSGVVVVTHWKQNNYLRSDRYKPTIFQKEMACLAEENDVYVYQTDTDMDTTGIPTGIPNGYQTGYQTNTNWYTQCSIDKNSIEESSKDKNSVVVVEDSPQYIPSIEEIRKYINNNNYTYNADYFYNYYKSRNWYIGNVPIADFEALKAIMDNWQSREKKSTQGQNNGVQAPKGVFNNYNQKVYSNEEIENILKRKEGKRLKRFDEFWELYPIKQHKSEAEIYWSYLSENDKLVDEIIEALKKQLNSEEWNDKDKKKFIPFPDKWLSNKRWNDELTLRHYEDSGIVL